MSQPRIALEQVRIQNPCHADWGAMSGTEQTRFCARCQRHVHDLSSMTREQAERLVCEAAGRLCVRMQVGTDGRQISIDYRRSLRQRPRRSWIYWTGIGFIGATIAALANAWQGRSPVPTPAMRLTSSTITVSMGVICPPPTQPALQLDPLGEPEVPELPESPLP